eukprot:524-Pyramimonas_sp.AAC.3
MEEKDPPAAIDDSGEEAKKALAAKVAEAIRKAEEKEQLDMEEAVKVLIRNDCERLLRVLYIQMVYRFFKIMPLVFYYLNYPLHCSVQSHIYI